MQYKIEVKSFGTANDLGEREDLQYLTNSQDIEWLLDMIGWDRFDFDEPTAIWVQVKGDELGDIFVTFSRKAYLLTAPVEQVIRTWYAKVKQS